MLKHFIKKKKKVSFIKSITTFREKRKKRGERGGKKSRSSCPNVTTVLLPFFSPPTSLVYGFLKKKNLVAIFLPNITPQAFPSSLVFMITFTGGYYFVQAQRKKWYAAAMNIPMFLDI